MNHRSPHRSNLIPAESAAKEIVAVIQDCARQIRNPRKRAEFVAWAKGWWLEQLREKAKLR